MKKLLLILAAAVFMPASGFAGFSYQNFEPQNGSATYGWSWDQNVQVGLSANGEPVHSGLYSWKMISNMEWGGMAVGGQLNPWHTNFDLVRNDRLVFWIYSLPQAGGNHNVGVKFFDHGNYSGYSGFQVWTTKTASYGQWTQLSVLFSQLPADFNLQDVDKIEFAMYWPGVYYFDDIAVIRMDRMYQCFEPELRSDFTLDEYAWKWVAEDVVGFSQGNEPVKEGLYSWKHVSAQKYGGIGIKSEEKRLLQTPSGFEQDFWYVDLHPEKNKALVFWVYGLPQNAMDNNLAVQFYDHGSHATDETKAVVWTKQAARNGAWARFTVRFSDLPESLNLHDLNKIQLQQYWPGTYYYDEIKATGALLKISEAQLSGGTVTWENIEDAGRYILQESRVGPDGPWNTVYSGGGNTYQAPWVTKTWYRVSWEEKDTPKPYVSEWSDIVQYSPAAVFIKRARLAEGVVEWSTLAQADSYEVQAASREEGPWSLLYSGPYRGNWLKAGRGVWYRVRALRHLNGKVICVTPWSRAQMYQSGAGFLAANGLSMRTNNGSGKEIVLQGVNLGSLLLIEPWMTGIGQADTPAIEDEWTMRQVLAGRFPPAQCSGLFDVYRQAYLQPADFDTLLDAGINMVRVPIYHRVLQNEDGTWVTDANGQIDFSPIDRIVNYCADRGIYVMLDLHGAPGSQSSEAHSGRKNYNKLFEESAQGPAFRNMTVSLWDAIARHYKDNQTVCGYDLLNEPFGAPSRTALWQIYDRLYRAIRAVDQNHIIVMEAIAAWEDLPTPKFMRWKNVAYQFHYYLWDNYENFQAHKDFIDQKVVDTRVKQKNYNVPVIIGEFNCFDLRSIWDYYLANFNREKWSWAMWSYKCKDAPSSWGLFNHAGYDLGLPSLRQDSLDLLTQKFRAYATADYHSRNFTLSQVIKDYAVPPVSSPFISGIVPETVLSGGSVIVKGINFGATQSNGMVILEGIPLPVTSWSNTEIRASLPANILQDYGMLKVTKNRAVSNEAVLHIIQPAAVSGADS